MRSKKLLEAYKTLIYWHHGFYSALWSRARPLLESAEQRQILYEAETLMCEAKMKIESVLGPEIGKAMMRELDS